jgi:hypothetical protein
VAERPPITAREHDVLVALCRPLANGDVFTESSSGRSRLANAALDADAVILAELRDR